MRSIHIFATIAILAGCGEVTDSANQADAPTVSSVSPDRGGIVGGSTITVTGTKFQANNAGTPIVVVGRNQATDVTVVSDTELTFSLPANEDEGAVVDVTVATANGFATLPGAFTYNLRPIVISITPTVGRGTGGTAITITGRGFADAGTPMITIAGGTFAGTVVNDTTITATTSAVEAGTKAFSRLDVEVANDNGSTRLANAFQITKPGLIALEGGFAGNRIFHVDIATGDVAVIATTDMRVHGCATSPSGQIFASTGRREDPMLHRLARFDPLTGRVTVIGNLDDNSVVPPVNRGISTLTFVGNTLYGIDTESPSPTNRLVTVNTTTGAVTVIGATPMAVTRPTAIAVKDAATVYVVDRANQSLDTALVANSTLTTGLAFVGGGSSSIKGLVNVGGTLYMTERTSPAPIYSVMQGANATLTRIATAPVQLVGLCETPPTF